MQLDNILVQQPGSCELSKLFSVAQAIKIDERSIDEDSASGVEQEEEPSNEVLPSKSLFPFFSSLLDFIHF